MNSTQRKENQKAFVEEIGRYFDKEGLQPIAGRILGLLMVMDKELFTFDEITEELQISKSSASIVLRNLQIRGEIEYITIPGDRRKYYQITYKSTNDIIESFYKKIINFKQIINKTLELKENKDSRNAKMFKDFMMIINYMEERIDDLKDNLTEK